MARHFLPGLRQLCVLVVLATPNALWGQTDRQTYIDARKALATSRHADFERLAARLTHYPLFPYLELAKARSRLATAEADQIRALLDRYPELPPARRLRSQWLKRLARERRWPEFLKDYQPQRSTTLRCQQAAARLAVEGALAYQPELWLAGKSQPDACDAVFLHWRQAGVLTPGLYFERAVLAVVAGNAKLVRYLARRCTGKQRLALDRWLALRANPGAQLLKAARWPDTALNQQMILSTLNQLKVRRNSLARSRWPALRKHFAFDPAKRAAMDRDLVLYYSTDYPADALEQLRALPAASRDLQILEWTARVALKTGDWAAVLSALDEMSPAAGLRDRWLYWRGRALEQLGREKQATAVFQTLARRANYFGFLAADRLGLPYALCPRPRDPNPHALAELAARPAMRRALELQALGHLHDARSEWNLAVAGLNREQRRQAALLAASEGWHDRAVLTLADTGHRQRYQLRFPLVWEAQVMEFASRFNLNPSLIYAVMRSESALVVDAVSGANAHGLMQLTPKTAREVAHAIGVPRPTRKALADPAVNLQLGSAYLGQLFERFGHPLLVLAAYNAGPEALQRWLAMGLPTEADRWIESIPYHETRDYVIRVLAFATIYDWRREGKMVGLPHRTPAMDKRPGVTDLKVSGGIVPQCME